MQRVCLFVLVFACARAFVFVRERGRGRGRGRGREREREREREKQMKGRGSGWKIWPCNGRNTVTSGALSRASRFGEDLECKSELGRVLDAHPLRSPLKLPYALPAPRERREERVERESEAVELALRVSQEVGCCLRNSLIENSRAWLGK